LLSRRIGRTSHWKKRRTRVNSKCVNEWDITPVLLLLLSGLALSIGTGIIVLAVRGVRHKIRATALAPGLLSVPPSRHPSFLRRPDCWLAIKSRDLRAVQFALGLHNAKPCSWFEGLAAEEKLFIGPPVKGWILVMGAGVPDPLDDVDACFRFVLQLSRSLGEVQLFSASRILHYHAWVRVNRGRVQRAYAWAGRTLWKQGQQTQAEMELGVRCFDYAEPAERAFGLPDAIAANADKVPLLAARWSLDPARIDEPFRARGIAGVPSLCY
jgi:hypothetical protein